MIKTIIIIIILIGLALFSIGACILSTRSNRYEGYRRKGESDDE